MALPIRKKIFDVAGEGQINDDGTPRQDIIGKCYPGDAVELVREPNNSYDENAVRIDYKHESIGYVNKKDAQVLAPLLDSKLAHQAIIHKLKGGVPDYPNYGVEISISWEGREPHPWIELDDAQEKLREKASDSNGCLGVIVFFVLCSAIVSFGFNTLA